MRQSRLAELDDTVSDMQPVIDANSHKDWSGGDNHWRQHYA